MQFMVHPDQTAVRLGAVQSFEGADLVDTVVQKADTFTALATSVTTSGKLISRVIYLR
jgi:hypothetical protein